MSLLEEIRTGATEQDMPISVVLRKCLILSKRLQHEPLEAWAQKELNGYGDHDEVPDYRRHPVQLKATLAGPLRSTIENYSVPHSVVPEEHRESIFNVRVLHGVGTLEALIAGGEGSTLSMPLEQDFTLRILGENLVEGHTAISSWRVMPKAILSGVLDTVRNRVLAFALEIESENPEAGESLQSEPPVPPATVQHHFETHIYGGSSAVAIGSPGATQTVQQVNVGDWDSLSAALKSVGVPSDDRDALRRALDLDEGKLGEETESWLGRMTAKLGRGALVLSGNVSVEALTELILKYTGLG